jgi:pimeloyl-ACP methyl ester carboxylesterase
MSRRRSLARPAFLRQVYGANRTIPRGNVGHRVTRGAAASQIPKSPQGRIPSWETIHAGWYQWLFQTPLAKPLLSADLEGFIRHAWTNWSPGWRFAEDDLQAVAHSAQNPDWIDVVLSTYGPPDHAAADPRDCEAHATLAKLPPITCPTLNLQGANDGVDLHVDTQLGQESYYKGPFSSEVLESCGHFLHRERPEAVAQKILGFLRQIPV